MNRKAVSVRRAAVALLVCILVSAVVQAGSDEGDDRRPSNPRVIVLKTGETVNPSGSIEVRGKLLVFRLEDGTLVSTRIDGIDREATRQANAAPTGREVLRARSKAAETSGPAPNLDSAVTLDLKDADVVDVLRFLAHLAEANLVVSQEVSGTITLRLTDVPLEEAFQVILKAKGLGMDRRSRIYWVAPRQRIIESLRTRSSSR